ncbi:MAG: antitoxin [Methylococcaceae bacterium]|nr:antitoxin [Methylococcaceae bacterium]MDP3905521.1 antitoxin [Methylococcaceae bacterium]
MTAKLSAEEKAIIEYVEGNEANSIDDVENEKNRYKQIAITQMSKKKAISIRLLESDIERIKAKSLSQGLPYQTLISSLIHQYANGKIKLEA